jgi:hypothetical protein
MIFFYFGWSGVYFIFILHLHITVTCRHTIVFYGKDCFSKIKTSSKRLEYFNIWWSLSYRRHHTFDVKTCFQQNRYVFDVIVTSWVLFVFCISWNFARDISTVYNCYVPTYHRFLRQRLLLKDQNVIKALGIF